MKKRVKNRRFLAIWVWRIGGSVEKSTISSNFSTDWGAKYIEGKRQKEDQEWTISGSVRIGFGANYIEGCRRKEDQEWMISSSFWIGFGANYIEGRCQKEDQATIYIKISTGFGANYIEGREFCRVCVWGGGFSQTGFSAILGSSFGAFFWALSRRKREIWWLGKKREMEI